MTFLDTLIFSIFPYVALFVFFLVTIQRYRSRTFTYSSLSSQLLENKRHFCAMVPFHFGLLAVLFGHLLAFLFPAQVIAWNSLPLRLYILEILGLAFAIMALIGLWNGIARRHNSSKLKVVTSPADWILYGLLLIQIVSGISIAVLHPWGSTWFSAVIAPYLWSVLKLNPDIGALSSLPAVLKMHIANAYLIIAFFPFTRLVHILVVPNPYLWRKTQVVRWYGKKD